MIILKIKFAKMKVVVELYKSRGKMKTRQNGNTSKNTRFKK